MKRAIKRKTYVIGVEECSSRTVIAVNRCGFVNNSTLRHPDGLLLSNFDFFRGRWIANCNIDPLFVDTQSTRSTSLTGPVVSSTFVPQVATSITEEKKKIIFYCLNLGIYKKKIPLKMRYVSGFGFEQTRGKLNIFHFLQEFIKRFHLLIEFCHHDPRIWFGSSCGILFNLPYKK